MGRDSYRQGQLWAGAVISYGPGQLEAVLSRQS